MLAAPAASAHVHGITPLLCSGSVGASTGIGNANSGANGTNGTSADDATGGPIKGLIPAFTGKADLTPMVDGGFKPPNNPHCP